MKAKTTEHIEYPEEFTVVVKHEEGVRELIGKHLDNLPGLEVKAHKNNMWYIVLQADDENHAIWRVRNHLRNVAGVLEVE